MRNYSKVGGKPGKPGFRSPARVVSKVLYVIAKIKSGFGYGKKAEKMVRTVHRHYDLRDKYDFIR